jgi:5-methylcytosine-specific restriction endonuclease McrA
MKPLSKRKETLAAEAKLRREVYLRDGWRCCFEVFTRAGDWERCGKRANECCHVIRRSQAPAARYEPDNALRGCRDCHQKYDAREEGIRVPLQVWNRAIKRISQVSKVPILAQWRGGE